MYIVLPLNSIEIYQNFLKIIPAKIGPWGTATALVETMGGGGGSCLVMCIRVCLTDLVKSASRVCWKIVHWEHGHEIHHS